jgi:hypothetical protein
MSSCYKCLHTAKGNSGAKETRTCISEHDPVAARSEAWVCGQSLGGIVGSNPAGGMDVCVSCECRVLSGRGLCDGPITRPEESCRMCVCLCVIK